MGKNPQKSHIPANQKPPQISHVEEEKFMAIMRQIGDNSLNNLSPENIKEVINQRGKIADYIHEENMQEHERFKILQKNSLIQLGVLLTFAVIVLLLVAFINKDYMPQAITLIIGFVGGFGVGKTVKEPTKKD
ncbi:hypothetical protein KJ980_07040 [Patescibacteria group bacterium]|nr:hypothetical protein [Patescibacteria group bacterium]MBU4016136.1 hypothetical protein [Patescibacteria group bacterium]MBU4099376.1 hypothetical protein [Patescibacteria group bacterium]